MALVLLFFKSISYPRFGLTNKAPNFYMVKKDFDSEKKYSKGFAVNELFQANNVGIVTSRDSFVIDRNKNALEKRIDDFFNHSKDQLQQLYKLKENKSWKIDSVKQQAKIFDKDCIKKIYYRPFDEQYIYYNDHFIERSRKDIMQNLLGENNLALALCKQFKSGDTYQHVFITNKMIESSYVSNKTSEITSVFPLYVYREGDEILQTSKALKPNCNVEIINTIEKIIGFSFIEEREDIKGTFAPIDVLDYIYAVLYSPKYREAYKEFLKIDFPKIPYPKTAKTFIDLAKLGSQLRNLHLMEDSILKVISQYPESGDNIVEKHIYKDGNVYINDEQYFANVPEIAWNFNVGGYQPAQKWLKDRKDQALQFEDIKHYQKIIATLQKTSQIMTAIDEIDFL